MAGGYAGSMRVLLSPRWGSLDSCSYHPRLAPWAAFFRRYAAKQLHNLPKRERLGTAEQVCKIVAGYFGHAVFFLFWFLARG